MIGFQWALTGLGCLAVALLAAVMVLGIPAAFPAPESRPPSPSPDLLPANPVELPGSGAQALVVALAWSAAPEVPADPATGF